ncbi:Helicase conserved C-terminal domain-containing protein [Dyella jiangningensis]|uniref:DEAD/DEAH box helicase n=1 Tax=Dyella sp. AtDHG13 TaxID=1938897 RepID=UPI00087F9CC6|nr:DEAD/DEAH box helicase [Dyella sp. AtDHG13]PXV55970.1 helicase-like protein [Dyella sp. AtDHG13]SDK48461.1 Helicase conserved C-terminal domain-containing protein [Dyella jiangningensis]
MKKESPPTGLSPGSSVEEARRVLMDAIGQLSLAAHFSRACLRRAELIARGSQRWHKPLAWFRPSGTQADALQGSLTEDGRTMQVTVWLYRMLGEPQLASQCSCGTAPCAHAAALLLRLQQLLDWPRAMSPVERWQQSLPLYQAPPSAPVMGETAAAWHPACLLDTVAEPDGQWLCARLVLVPGTDGMDQPQRWIGAESAKARPHLSRQVTMWLAQLALGRRLAGRPSDGYLLQGHSGAALLLEWLEAGICRHASTLQPLTAGLLRRPPWHWRVDEDGTIALKLVTDDGEAVIPLSLDSLHYLDEGSHQIGQLDLDAITWAMVRDMPVVTLDEREPLREAWPPHACLAAVPPPPPTPPSRPLDAPMRPVVVIGASRHAQRGHYVFHLQALADYASRRLPLVKEAWRTTWNRLEGAALVSIHRDIDAEHRAREALLAAGLATLATILPSARRELSPLPVAEAWAHREWHEGDADTFVALETHLQNLRRDGFAIEYAPDLPFAILGEAPRFHATLAPDEGTAWTQFELAATLDSGEEIDVLPLVLAGLAGRQFPLLPATDEPPDAHWLAPLGPGRWLPLRLDWLRSWLHPLMECLRHPGQLAGHRALALSRTQAMAVSDALDRQGVALAGARAEAIGGMLAALRDAMALPAPPLPASFRGNLRSYQRDGLKWLQALRTQGLGGVLADDMGLGKTVQIIAHLLLEADAGRLTAPALIVAPTSLVFNWLDEITRFAPSLRHLNYTGPSRTDRLPDLPGTQVVVTSYALLANDIDALAAQDFSVLVLDEAQWIKNPRTRTARAVRRLRAPHRLAVTGTPLENHLGELWAHFDAVMPGYLGDQRSFQRTFRVPIERQDDHQRRDVLRQRIAPFLLRRRKADVAPELPSKTETVLRIAMGETQRQLYESLRLAMHDRVRDALARHGDEASQVVVLSALLRLRQACCDPRLLELPDPPPSAKLDALLELIQSLRDEDRQVLVFSQFTSMLALISTALEQAGHAHAQLTGDTTDRAEPVRRFQQREVPILLASLKAGGVGLNLTAADAVIHYDPWWNPAVEQQAIDRAHRLGREQPVFVYKLLCEDTVEDRIESMKSDKAELADLLLDKPGAPAAADARTLHALFAPNPSP